MSRWAFGAVDPAAEALLVKRVGVSPLTAQVLVTRGFRTPEAARTFLYPDLRQAHDPFLMSGMEEAVERVALALEHGERVLVYGDYDVDGQSATALLVRTLRMLGARVAHYVPHRVDEGYGLHRDAVEAIAGRGITLIITVDCGVTAVSEVEKASALGVDVIITDHHQPPDKLPAAHAVLNPHRPGCSYPDKQLAGVGVAYKFARALASRLGGDRVSAADIDALLDLVALGTVADAVSLLGENRALVRVGLERMNQSPAVGLAALIQVAGIADSPIGAGQIAWMLGPRLNAVGRMDDAAVGVRLLLTDDPEEATRLAIELDEHNTRRQQVEADVFEKACREIDGHAVGPLAPGVQTEPTDAGLVASGDGWHPGVIGIVASRLVERYDRPAIVLSVDGEEAKGSGRSVPGLDLYAVLADCEGMLTQFGGHPMAAGLRLPTSMIGRFADRFARLVGDRLEEGRLEEIGRADALVELGALNEGAVRELAALGPFGVGNPGPTIVTEALRPVDVRAVGADRRHLKLKLADRASVSIDAIGFEMADEWLGALNAGAPSEQAPVGVSVGVGPAAGAGAARAVHAVGVPELNVWRGRARVQLRLRDLRPAYADGGDGSDAGDRPPFERPTGRDAVCWELDGEGEQTGDGSTSAGGRPAARTVHDGRGAGSALSAAVRLFWSARERDGEMTEPFRLYHRTKLAAFETAAALWEAYPELRPSIGLEGRYVHLGRSAARDGRAAGRENVVLIQMPPTPALLARRTHRAGAVWLLYPADDAAAGRRELQVAYPDRLTLAQLYRACVQSAGARGGVLERVDRLAAAATHLAGETVPVETVRAGLEIFAELRLVVLDGDDFGTPVRLGPKPDGKLDLGVSVRYNQGVRARALFADAVKLSLRSDESLSELFQTLPAS